MKFRPMLRTSFNAQTIFGRRRLRSSAALRAWQTRTINEFEVHLCLQEEALPDGHPATARKFTISQENAPNFQTMLGTLWCEGTTSYQDMAAALQMFSEVCSGPH